ncbi:MAG: hypothetical protein PVG65_04680 [Candidatus Thorarchaeota archaeon]|jgi:hypothetical protein
MKLTISLDKEEVKILKRRAKKNYLTLKEQVEDIIRLSCIRSSHGKYRPIKIDDKLVAIFSRDRRGRKKKNKKK